MTLDGHDDPSDEEIAAVRHAAGYANGKPRLRVVTEAASGDWQCHLKFKHVKGQPDKLCAHHANVSTILTYHPAWAGRVFFDEHACRTVVRDAPWPEHEQPMLRTSTPGMTEWTDNDSNLLSSWLLSNYQVEMDVGACDRGVTVAAYHNTVHPFRDQLDSFVWDKTERLNWWLSTYLGVEPSAFASSVGAWWLISAVARTYQPGCKADHVLILEGEQGTLKSTALRILAGQQWFSDTPIDIGNKDAFLQIQGLAIVELAEMESVIKSSGAHGNRAKTFFSSSVDDYRPPYGRRMVRVPRGCVFCGTVNPRGAYLTDSSGERRYWAVTCGAIDLARLAADREQLWAEAVYRYSLAKSTEERASMPAARWWPVGEAERALCADAIAPRSSVDPWHDTIVEWSVGREGDFSVKDVWKGAMGGDVKDLDSRSEQRIGRALAEPGLGIRKVQTRGPGGTRPWVYRRG